MHSRFSDDMNKLQTRHKISNLKHWPQLRKMKP